MTSDEIRAAFLDFFEKKGHKVMPSSSLIPQGDPTLLLTTAGMVPFKPYFLGEIAPPSRRLASCQKCFRTTDIESVGDSKHLTFFEMLGNFSIGDYFKREAINWGWEFVTRHLRLPPQNLWITIFLDDDESFGYWREIGVPEERIVRFGEEDNFWGPAGNTGPCGPCSEIHYDFGEKAGCGESGCAPNCACGRFVEIWNLVFTQYNQDETGRRTPLPRPNIDTGMGLERAAAVAQGKTSVYQTDLFTPLLDRISSLVGKRYGADADTDNSMRIVAEHGRGITFLIADGVMPGNEGRGYVLRRLLRRAALFCRRLAADKPLLVDVARTTIGRMGHVYPELTQKQEFILKAVSLEEAKFGESTDAGVQQLYVIMAEREVDKKISGEDVFKLYDTYGLHPASTTEIAREHGFSVDMAGFEKEMEKQRERARAAHKFENKETVRPDELDVTKTSFIGYENLEYEATIARILVDDEAVEVANGGQEAGLVLDATPFYGEMGGQVGDTGEIRGPSGRFVVTNTVRIPPGVTVHLGHVAEGQLKVGDEVQAEVDKERRLDIARNHTATHLLQSALRQVLGAHAEQRGSLVAPERLRFDFSHLTAPTREEIQKVEGLVNDKVRQNLPVYSEETSYRRAIAEGAMALFSEKYGDSVRVMKIGKPTTVSAELCGGTHVDHTGEVGCFHIISESSIGSGLRRIEAVTGREAEAFFDKLLSRLEKIGQSLGASMENVEDKLTGLIAELDKERKRAVTLERELARKEAESLLGRVEVVNGVNLLVARVSPSSQQILREMSDLVRERLKSAVIVLGTVYEDRPAFLAAVTPDLVAKGYSAGDIVKQVAKVAGGGGGGKPGLAQAGGKHKEKVDEALALVKSLIK